MAPKFPLLRFFIDDAQKKHKSKSQASSSTDNNSTTNNYVGNQSGAAGGNKGWKSKNHRGAQDSTHPWMVGAMKGHTGPVLDVEFAENKKFLASCSKDCGSGSSKNDSKGIIARDSKATRSEKYTTGSKNMSSSNGTSSHHLTRNVGKDRANNDMDSAAGPSFPRSNRDKNVRKSWKQGRNRPMYPRNYLLSNDCIQKNETRFEKITTNSKSCDEINFRARSGSKIGNKNEIKINQIVKHYSAERLRLMAYGDLEITQMLHQYILNQDTLKHLGYPYADMHDPNKVRINYRTYGISQNVPSNNRIQNRHTLDVNAREFVPKSKNTLSEVDSGTGSASSNECSDLEQEIECNMALLSCKSKKEYKYGGLEPIIVNKIERTCARCSRPFYVDSETNEHLNEEKCNYHWGKFRDGPAGSLWNCCNTIYTTLGCSTANVHVWSGIIPEYTGPFVGFVKMPPPSYRALDYGVYGLDCEMCFTKFGLELTKITVIGICGNIVYDTYVKPESKIIDYCTRFSGITEKDLENVTTTLHDVHKHLMSFMSSETILIGHGLENDLRILKIIHGKIIDTSLPMMETSSLSGAYYGVRSSLKTIAKRELQRNIQVGEHDSVEDAQIVIDIVLRRLWTKYNVQ